MRLTPRTPSARAARPLAALGALGALVLTLLTPLGSAAPAHAADSLDHGSISVAYDGTGHGTPDASKINSGNGYAPADDTPDDRVVSTRDTVGYDIDLRFAAGPARTVRVQLDTGGAPIADPGYCASGPGFTATGTSADCTFRIDRGAVASVHGQAIVTASDALAGGSLDAVLSIDGVPAQRPDSVQVVAAPELDFVLQNRHGTYFGPDRRGRAQFWIRAGDLLTPGHSVEKGSLRASTFSGWLDVSDWPDGTTWTVAGRQLPVDGGRIHLDTLPIPNDADLNTWTPATTILVSAKLPDGTWPVTATDPQQAYDTRIIIDPDSITVGDLRNNGDGSQPGQNQPADHITADPDRGSPAGASYPNNDLIRVTFYGRDEPSGLVTKEMWAPHAAGQTVFHDSNRVWLDWAASRAGRDVDRASDRSRVAAQTELNAQFPILTDRLNAGTAPQFSICDAFESRQRLDIGDRQIIVTDGDGNTVPASLYRVDFHDDLRRNACTTPAADSDGWTPDPTADTSTVRISFAEGVVRAGTGTWKVDVPFRSLDEYTPQEDGDLVANWMSMASDDSETTSESVRRDFQIAVPRDVELRHEHTSAPDTVGVGATISSKLEEIRVANRTDAAEPFTISGEIVLDRCVTDVVVLGGDGWSHELVPAVPGASGGVCGAADSTPARITVSYTGVGVYDSALETTRVPAFSYTANPSQAAVNGDLTDSSTLTLDTASSTDGSTVVFSMPATTGQTIRPLTPLVEVDDPLVWEAALSSRDSAQSGPMQSVIVLPRIGDESILDGLSPQSRAEFEATGDPDRSAFTGGYTLVDARVVGEHSTPGTTLEVTSDPNAGNPGVESLWVPATAGNLADATAIRVTAPDDGGTVRAATVRYTLQPTGNRVDDVYLSHLTAATLGGATAAPQPWPVAERVVDSSISGTVWWDLNDTTRLDDDEPGIPNVTVELLDRAGVVLAATQTGDDGTYRFDELRSGGYTVRVVPTAQMLQVASRYGDTLDVRQTYSHDGQRRTSASPDSSPIQLRVDHDLARVDFGFFAPDPALVLDKTPARVRVDGGIATVTWQVDVHNDGNTPVRAPALTDRMDSRVENVQATVEVGEGRPKPVRFTDLRVDGTMVKAFSDDGDLWSWGYGEEGQNGDGLSQDSAVPVPVTAFDGLQITSLVARPDGYYAVTSDGRVWSWGTGWSGANGNGSEEIETVPRPVQGLDGVTIVSVAARGYGARAIDSEGRVWSWGAGASGQNGNGSNADSFTAGLVQGLDGVTIVELFPRTSGTYALDSEGRVWSWGAGASGQNGNGSNAHNLTAGLVQGLDGVTVVKVVPATYGGFAIASDGTVWAWGSSQRGQTGVGSTTNLTVAEQVTGLAGKTIVDIVHSYPNGALAIASDGTVWTWGNGQNGNPGHGSTDDVLTPQQVAGLAGKSIVKAVVRTFGSYTVLASDGTVWSWGRGAAGANGTGGVDNLLTPQQVTGFGGRTITDIVSRGQGVVALASDGTAWSWGRGWYGGNGDGSTDDNLTPDMVQGLDGVTVVQIRARGELTALALAADGTAWAWGSGGSGMLGDGASTPNLVAGPVTMPLIPAAPLIPATPVVPVSVSQADGFTTRVYEPSTIQPGQTVRYTFTGTVRVANEDQYVVNQAWASGEDVPRTQPGLPPTVTSENYSPEGVSSAGCTGVGWDGDICDATPALIPAPPPTAPLELGGLAGVVWEDADGDGLRGPGEATRAGARVTVMSGDGIVVGETFTGPDGAWEIRNVAAGDYRVQVEAHGPDRNGDVWRYTTPDAGADDTVDSDVDRYGVIGTVTVPPGEMVRHNDAGLVRSTVSLTVDKTIDGADGATLELDPATGLTRPAEVRIVVANPASSNEPVGGLAWDDLTVTGIPVTGLAFEDGFDGVLDPGESVTITGVLPPMPPGSVHADTVTVTGTSTISGVPVTADDPSSADAPDAEPGVSVVKHLNDTAAAGAPTGQTGRGEDSDANTSPVLANPDGTVTTVYVVTNTGNVPLHSVTLTGPETGRVDCPDLAGRVLLPGETIVCHGPPETVPDTGGDYSTPVTVTAVTRDGEGRPTGSVTASDPALAALPAPGLEVVKSATTDGPYAHCQEVTWTYTVTNTGNTPVASVDVTDDRGVEVTLAVPPAGSTVDGWDRVLAPGEVAVFTGTGPVCPFDPAGP